MSSKMKCKIVTHEEVYSMVRALAEKVKASSYRPATIVGLARGGWVPARLMCDFLGVTDLLSLKVEHWLETGKTGDEAKIKYPLMANLRGKHLLVVDDITDTGKSLIASTDYLKKFAPKELRTATMQYIPTSAFKPDYYVEEVRVWTWFIYPWNWIEDTTTLIVRLMSAKKEEVWTSKAISTGLEDLFEIRWNQKMMNYMLRTMVHRGQIGRVRGGYKLKEVKVVHM
ncbi:MAG: phosphoribosyltransferase [Candidatus Bathyarchaeia archaeon]